MCAWQAGYEYKSRLTDYLSFMSAPEVISYLFFYFWEELEEEEGGKKAFYDLEPCVCLALDSS